MTGPRLHTSFLSGIVGRRRVVGGAALGVLGFALNLVPLSIAPGIDALFGGIAAIVAGVTLGPLAGLVAGAIAGIPTLWLWSHPWAWLIFSLEGLGVGILATRGGRRPLTATAGYWVLVGVPLLLLTYHGLMGVGGTTLTIIALKQPLNGLVNAVIAEGLLLVPVVRRALRVPAGARLRAALAVVLLLASVTPALVFGVWAGRREWSRSLQVGEERAQLAAATYAAKLGQYIQLHEMAVASTAALIPGGAVDDGARLQRLLRAELQQQSGLLNMYVADARGVTIAFEPATDPAGRSLIGLDFSDREYYRAVRETGRSVVSEVFPGRGGADLPLVVIAHPVVVADTFAGFVLGALDLGALPRATSVPGIDRLRVLDPAGRIVFDDADPYTGGDSVRVETGAVVERIMAGEAAGVTTYHRDSPAAVAARIAAQVLAGHAPVAELGWTVWADYPYTRIESAVAVPYTRLLALLVGLVILGALLSSLLSGLLAAPLLRIRWAAAALASGDLGARVRRLPAGVPHEIAELGYGFDEMADRLSERAEELEELGELARALASTLESDAVLRQVTDATAKLLHADGAGIALLDREGHVLRASEYSIGSLAASAGKELPLDGSLVGWVARERRSARVTDIARDPRLHREGMDLGAIGSIISSPLIGRSGVLGTLTATRAAGVGQAFNPDDLRLLERLARTGAVAVENARLIEAAHAASRAKSDFIAAMSHELRTPLNAVLGHLQLIELELHGPLTAEQRSAMARIGAATRHLRSLIEEVLSFARLEAGRAVVHHADVDLDEIAREVAAVIEPLAWEKRLKFAVVSEGAGVVIRTDPNKLRQILINLAGNAVKFTEEGEVRLRVERVSESGTAGESGGAAILVEDTGPGISGEDLVRLFRPFEQLESGLSRRHGGTGLGLYLSGQYARLIGARIEVRSEPGQGSTFSLVLPATAPLPEEISAATPAPDAPRPTGFSTDG